MTEQPPVPPTDDEGGPAPEGLLATGSRVEPIDLQLEMQRSYLDYAMSVIVSRALPDVRDGLKPVHRRVLYAMYDGGYRPDRSFSKCARVVGDVMGNYHPHGDSAIYDTLVRLAQPWALRYPLVQGQGNFGSPGNDPAAAMRYCISGDSLVRMADGFDGAYRGSRPRCPAQQRHGRRPQGQGPLGSPGDGKQGLPLGRAPDAAAANAGGLRAHRHAQPPGPDDPIGRGGPDAALEPAGGGRRRRPRRRVAAAPPRVRDGHTRSSGPKVSSRAPG